MAGDPPSFPPWERLVTALDALPARVTRGAQLARARRAFAAVLTEHRWLERHTCGAPPFPRHANGFLALRVAARYVVYAGEFPPRYRSLIHDHGAWGLIGTWRGEEVEERFAVAARGRGGRVRLRATGGTINAPGYVSVLVPRIDEIHRVGNVRGRPAFSLHIYGRGAGTRPGRWYAPPGPDGWTQPIPEP